MVLLSICAVIDQTLRKHGTFEYIYYRQLHIKNIPSDVLCMARFVLLVLSPSNKQANDVYCKCLNQSVSLKRNNSSVKVLQIQES